MGFFETEVKRRTAPSYGGMSVEMLHRHECNVCPLNNQAGNRHPHMEPTGSKRPVVYMLGEAPGETEDYYGEQFIGKAGQTLRPRIPDRWLKKLRWNNCVRTRPPKNKTPSPIEIECCRPSVVRDIEASKPKAIFGFGAIPLKWALNQTGITKWNGRYIPVKIGSHTCWFFPMMHPSYVMRTRKYEPDGPDDWGSEAEFRFILDLENAFSVVEKLPKPVVHSPSDVLDGCNFVTGHGGMDIDRVMAVLEDMAQEEVVGVDYETNGLRPYPKDARILTIGLANKTSAFAFPYDHPKAGWSKSEFKHIKKAYEQFLYHSECRKVAHNLSFEHEWNAIFFGRRSLRATPWTDTMAQAYILDERSDHNDAHSLDWLCTQYFGISIKSVDPVDRKNIINEPLDKVLPYNGMDAKYCRKLYFKQLRRLREEGLLKTAQTHNRKVATLVLSQVKGLPISQREVSKLHDRYTDELSRVTKKIKNLDVVKKFKRDTGENFRPSANRDLVIILNNYLGISTKSVNEDVLSKVKHPIAKLMVEWRHFSKMRTNYVRPVMKGSPLLDDKGRIHPVYKHSSTKTTRTSAEDPAVQTWPKHGDGDIVRKQVKSPSAAWCVVSFDYAGLQARNIAMESKDERLVEMFWNEYDMHGDWMEWFVKAYPRWVKEGAKQAARDKSVYKAYRHRAKNEFVFPTFFGAQPFSISHSMGIPEDVVEEGQHEFFSRHPNVRKWQRGITKQYRKYGYVSGLSGIRRRAPISPNKLINSPIQADEVALVLAAMSRLSEYELIQYQPNIEIHDDFTFVWPKKRVEQYAEVVVKEMTRKNFDWINVPIVVEMSVGQDWLDVKEVAAFSSNGWDGIVQLPDNTF